MITTAIFDLDGLLADTERLHRQAYQEAFAQFGVRMAEGVYEEHWIRCGRGIEEYVREHGLALVPEAVRAEKARRYRRLVATAAQPMPGARELLARLQGRKTMALASSAYSQDVRAVLQALGIESCFAVIAGRNEVERIKPHPDLFLYVARRLGVPPGECVVLEDAEKGIVAAHAAGMPSIAVPNEYTRDNDFSLATVVLPSLDAVTLELLERLG